jgi:CheY-like chemotaxis protein
MEPTILLIDDVERWGTWMAESLSDEGFQVIWGRSKRDAISFLEKNKEIEAVITNLNLIEGAPVLDGQGYLILEYLQEHYPQLPKIVISTLGNEGERVGDLYHRYKVNYVAIKSDKELVPKLVHELRELFSTKRRPMNWESIITTVVSAITPYAVTLGTSAVSAAGAKFGESVFSNVQNLWEWIRQNIEGKGDEQDKQIWEDFKNEPVKYQSVLAQTLLRLAPTEDVSLRKDAENLIQELYRLLDNYNNFSLTDLKRICGRLSVHWENEVPNPTTESLARWAATYVRTRHKEQDLVAAILEINPDALPR